MTKKQNLIEAIKNLIEAILSSLGYSSIVKKRTWHQHVVPYKEVWAVRREGNKRVTSKYRKQSTAINKTKIIAKRYNADVIIHREIGGIRKRISYK
ncbi:DUF2188 domain-containing protein [uncultured Winogradskyella sp.]|uniref:DUF2188 domain-containing protein n=1 Tax=uncultured Winogradskyella sp. TaxID=395353 RepID=UPI0030EEE2C9|tara:strand:+ start:375 stop:662 length:288 start_codon:yes stop_codon:yes gene_type:complete